jgi:hypothetical protein
MHHAKRAVPGVGGKTEAVALQNDGRTHWFGTIATQKIEELIVNYEAFKTKVLDEQPTTTTMASGVLIASDNSRNSSVPGCPRPTQ